MSPDAIGVPFNLEFSFWGTIGALFWCGHCADNDVELIDRMVLSLLVRYCVDGTRRYW